MAYTTINKSTDYFNTKLYTGTGSSNSVTGVGFQPDFTWIKNRDQADEHNVYDAVRGATKRIITNDTSAEGTQSNGLSAFGSDGFTVVDSNATNINNENYASWNWKANGQGSSNTDGSINTTYTSVNTTAGFSISKFTGTGANATVGHGLGAVPKMMIFKNLDQATEGWMVYHASTGNTKRLLLDDTAAASTSSTFWQDTTPTSSLFYVGSNHGMNGPHNMIAYCFAEKTGYSKFGSYTGNGNADGSFIYTGFKPAFVIFKQTNTTGNWGLLDSTRSYANVANHTLAANSSNAESSFGGGESVFGASNKVDILSNGIKIREASNYNNTSGATYIYMCFSEAPLVGTNNVPCTAR